MSCICIPVQMNLIKAMERKAPGPSPLREAATFPPQADHVFIVLFFIRCVKAPRNLGAIGKGCDGPSPLCFDIA